MFQLKGFKIANNKIKLPIINKVIDRMKGSNKNH